jgi:hypothetical protein
MILANCLTNKKATDLISRFLLLNFVENIGFDRRKLVFGEAGIPLKNKYLFIPATVFPQVSNAVFLIASRRSR